MEEAVGDQKLIKERDELVDRLRKELHALVRESGWTQRQVDKANGYSSGYISQVLSGSITLTVRHLCGIVLAIGMKPEDFFARVFPGQLPDDELRERIARYDDALEQLEHQGLVKPPPSARQP